MLLGGQDLKKTTFKLPLREIEPATSVQRVNHYTTTSYDVFEHVSRQFWAMLNQHNKNTIFYNRFLCSLQ